MATSAGKTAPGSGSATGKFKSDDTQGKSGTPGSKNNEFSEAPYPVPQLIASPEELFLSELRDTYWAENHLLVALPKMIEAATDGSLQKALTTHLEETRNQVSRLEQVFELIGANAVPKKCVALEGLAISGEDCIRSTRSGTTVRDTAIISSGIKVENFEIVTYEGLIRMAGQLGYDNVTGLLQESLAEEKQANDLLNSMARQPARKS